MHQVKLQREVGVGKESERSCGIMQYRKYLVRREYHSEDKYSLM